MRRVPELARDALGNAPAGALSTGSVIAVAQRRADALALVAESFAAHGPAALRGEDRHLVTVHVDAGMPSTEDGPGATGWRGRPTGP